MVGAFRDEAQTGHRSQNAVQRWRVRVGHQREIFGRLRPVGQMVGQL